MGCKEAKKLLEDNGNIHNPFDVLPREIALDVNKLNKCYVKDVNSKKRVITTEERIELIVELRRQIIKIQARIAEILAERNGMQ
jgi:hypothetical protein